MMINPHIIALDLDGTLLKDDKTISNRAKRTLQKAREQGHHVVISTGRPYRASHMYYKELRLSSPIVNFNGSYVHHPLDSSFDVYHSALDLSIAKEIVHSCKEIGTKNMFAEGINNVYAHQTDKSFNEVFQVEDGNFYEGDLLEILQENPTCLLIDSTEEKVEAIRSHLTNIHADVIEHRRWGVPWNLIEVIKSGVNKAVGLQKVASYYGIPKERIIAFGDEDNDFEMIEYVGHGIAMGNAIPQLKALANDVTLTNEEDGVSSYLETFLKL